jgi:hypothetical protein
MGAEVIQLIVPPATAEWLSNLSPVARRGSTTLPMGPDTVQLLLTHEACLTMESAIGYLRKDLQAARLEAQR